MKEEFIFALIFLIVGLFCLKISSRDFEEDFDPYLVEIGLKFFGVLGILGSVYLFVKGLSSE